MLPLMVTQYVVISLRFVQRALVVATKLLVARAMAFLCSSGPYTTLLISFSFLKGRRRLRALGVSNFFMMHLDII